MSRALMPRDLREIAFEDIERVGFLRRQLGGIEVADQHFERIGDMAQLLAVATDLVEDPALGLGVAGFAQRDVDETELVVIDIPRPRVDRLPQLVRREADLEGIGIGRGKRKKAGMGGTS
ncbi:hypothetical protein ACFSTD_22160 [Novosphingobium colocasiae]